MRILNESLLHSGQFLERNLVCSEYESTTLFLSRRINEVKTVLRSKGITMESYLADTSTGLRGIKICKVASEPSVPSEDQISSQNNDGKCHIGQIGQMDLNCIIMIRTLSSSLR
jgi:hypothetical protein